MILHIYSVYDSKAKAFLPPFFMHNDALAKRIFGDCASDPKHQFNKHPEDYSLFCLGSWDDQNALIEQRAQATNLGLAGIYQEGYKAEATAQ